MSSAKLKILKSMWIKCPNSERDKINIGNTALKVAPFFQVKFPTYDSFSI
jgi:hypothetical protein